MISLQRTKLFLHFSVSMQFFDELRNQLKCDSDSPPQNYKSTFSFAGSFLLVLCILAHVYVSWRSRSIISVFSLQLHFFVNGKKNLICCQQCWINKSLSVSEQNHWVYCKWEFKLSLLDCNFCVESRAQQLHHFHIYFFPQCLLVTVRTGHVIMR